MVGLGGQEILLLLCCGGVPVTIAVIAFLVGRLSARSGPRRDPADDPDEW